MKLKKTQKIHLFIAAFAPLAVLLYGATGNASANTGAGFGTQIEKEKLSEEEIKKRFEERKKYVRDKFAGGHGDQHDHSDKRDQILSKIEKASQLPYPQNQEALFALERAHAFRQKITDIRESDLPWHQRKAQIERLKSQVSQNIRQFNEIAGINQNPGHEGSSPGGNPHFPPSSDIERYRGYVGADPVNQGLLTDAFMREDRPRDAAAAAADWVLMDPQNPEAHLALAQSHYDFGDYKTAREAGLRALDLDPRNGKAKTMIKLTAGYDRPTDAARPPAAAGGPAPDYNTYAAPVLKTNPVVSGPSSSQLRSARNMAARAHTKIQQGDYRAAASDAGRALDFDPRNARAHYVNIAALMGLKDFNGALRAVDKALEYDPNNSKFLAARAKILNKLGRYDAALASADGAVRADAGNADAYLQRAWALDGLTGRRAQVAAALANAGRLNARYADYAERFEGFEDGELAALLSGEGAPQTRETASTGGAAWSGLGDNPRLVMMGLASVIGGFLIALGFLRSASSGGKELWRRFAVFFGRESPSVGASRSPDSSGDAGGVLSRNYDVKREIGNGGMGVVYEGRDRTLDRRVAIKKMRDEIRSDARERERFISEARTVATLHHPNIVEIFSIVEDGYDAFLIFEFVDGATVHDILHRKKRLPFSEAAGVLRGSCAALDYAHAKGVIHRDLKPSNVMISAEGMVKVMDFGVARLAKDSLTRLSRTNTVVGTPPYMAPEQEQGLVRKASDVYALGVMLYEMVTGRLPFQGVGAGMLMAKINKTYVPASRIVSGLPEGFDGVLGDALEPDPEKRIPTAGELARRLESLAVVR